MSEDSQRELLENILGLRILLDTKLKFIVHINMSAKKARRVLGCVKRWSKEFEDPSLLRPIMLEYDSIIWNTDILKSVQKQFALFCLRELNFNLLELSAYASRLGHIKLPTFNSTDYNVFVPQCPTRYFEPLSMDFRR